MRSIYFILLLLSGYLFSSCSNDSESEEKLIPANGEGVSFHYSGNSIYVESQYFWINEYIILSYYYDGYDLEENIKYYEFRNITYQIFTTDLFYRFLNDEFHDNYPWLNDIIITESINLNSLPYDIRGGISDAIDFINKNKYKYKYAAIYNNSAFLLFNRTSNVNYY